jgi:hypothetical protein
LAAIYLASKLLSPGKGKVSSTQIGKRAALALLTAGLLKHTVAALSSTRPIEVWKANTILMLVTEHLADFQVCSVLCGLLTGRIFAPNDVSTGRYCIKSGRAGTCALHLVQLYAVNDTDQMALQGIRWDRSLQSIITHPQANDNTLDQISTIDDVRSGCSDLVDLQANLVRWLKSCKLI